MRKDFSAAGWIHWKTRIVHRIIVKGQRHKAWTIDVLFLNSSPCFLVVVIAPLQLTEVILVALFKLTMPNAVPTRHSKFAGHARRNLENQDEVDSAGRLADATNHTKW